MSCSKCKSEYERSERHDLGDCLTSLVKRVEQLEKEKVDRDSLLTLLLRKVDKKSNDQLLHLLVNDFDAAKNQINKQMGSIRIYPRNNAQFVSGSGTLKQPTTVEQD